MLLTRHDQRLTSDLRTRVADLRRALRAYELKLTELTPKLAEQSRRLQAAERAYEHANAEVNRWVEFLVANPHAAATALSGQRMLMGVALSPLLPRPKAPDGYVPHMLEGESLAKQVQHLFGLHAEAHLANRIAEDLHETVVEFGDKVGTNGADTTSVDTSGLPTLWDSKYRSSGVKYIESETFTIDSRLRKAADQAVEAVLRNPDGRLSPLQVATATQHLAAGNFVAYTVTSADATTFHSAVKMEFQNFKLVKTERMTKVPWGNGR